MGNRTSSPERSGRLYYNDSYEDTPAAAPLAMRALRAAYVRRAALAQSALGTVKRIDDSIGNGPQADVPPPDKDHEHRPELDDLDELANLRRRKLGSAAATAAADLPAAA